MTTASILVSVSTGILALTAAITAGQAVRYGRSAGKELECARKEVFDQFAKVAEKFGYVVTPEEVIRRARRRAPDRIGRTLRWLSLSARWRPVADSDLQVGGGRRTVRPARVARGLAEAASLLLLSADRARYSEEFRSELWDLAQVGAGRLRQLRCALRQLRSVLSLRWALRSPRRRNAAP